MLMALLTLTVSGVNVNTRSCLLSNGCLLLYLIMTISFCLARATILCCRGSSSSSSSIRRVSSLPTRRSPHLRHGILPKREILERRRPFHSIAGTSADDVFAAAVRVSSFHVHHHQQQRYQPRVSRNPSPPSSSSFLTQRRQWFWSLSGGGSSSSDGQEELTTQPPPPSAATTALSPSLPPLLGQFPVSAYSVRGKRSTQEDAFLVASDVCAVFDGHGGPAVSRYARQNLVAHLQAAVPHVIWQTEQQEIKQQRALRDEAKNRHDDDDDPNNKTVPKQNEQHQHHHPVGVPLVPHYEEAMRLALDKVDREVLRINHWSYQGSTAVAVWVHQQPPTTPTTTIKSSSSSSSSPSSSNDEHSNNRRTTTSLVVANIGDSRAILSRNGAAVPLSWDHKPNDPNEHARIVAEGGCVTWHGFSQYGPDHDPAPVVVRCSSGGDGDGDGENDAAVFDEMPGIFRVNGNLALSRALGDRSERPAVSAQPDIISLAVEEDEDDFVLLATDGLFDVLTNQEVVSYIHALLAYQHEHPVTKDGIVQLLVQEALRRGSYDNITVVIIWLKEFDQLATT